MPLHASHVVTVNISFGDNVRILRTPETERIGIAEMIGNVYGETTPSESKVIVIGALSSDYAMNVYFDSLDSSYWLAPHLLEFVNHASGTEVFVHGSSTKSVRQRDGTWKDIPVNVPDASGQFRERRSRTWRAVRWWLLIGVIAILTFLFTPGGKDRALSQGEFTFMMVCFFLAAGSIIFLIRGILTHYRCPNCNEIPMTSSFKAGGGGISYRRGVDLNPLECSHCGARLKPGGELRDDRVSAGMWNKDRGHCDDRGRKIRAYQPDRQ